MVGIIAVSRYELNHPVYRRNAAACAAADKLYLYGGGLTPELAQPINRTFRGVHLPAYLRREDLAQFGREDEINGTAEAVRRTGRDLRKRRLRDGAGINITGVSEGPGP